MSCPVSDMLFISIVTSDSRLNSGTELKLWSRPTLEALSTKPVIPGTIVWSGKSRGSFSFTKICLCALGLEIFCWSWISVELCRSLNLRWLLDEPGIPTRWSCSPVVSNTLLWAGSEMLILSWLFWHCSAFSFSFRDLKYNSLLKTNAWWYNLLVHHCQFKCQQPHTNISQFHPPANSEPMLWTATFNLLLSDQICS